MFCVIHDASSAVLLPFKVLLWLLDGEKPLRGDCTKTFYNGRSETEGTILKGVQTANMAVRQSFDRFDHHLCQCCVLFSKMNNLEIRVFHF